MQRGVAIAFCSVFAAACASDLDRVKKQQVPVPVESLDLSLVNFTDVYSGEQVNLREYMQGADLEHMVLMFGSVGCSTCNDKALKLSDGYFGKHELFIAGGNRGFELVGVNTDGGGAERRFKSIMLNPESREQHGYDFVKWADPSGAVMKQYLLGDRGFGVPFTVMINRSGIVWRFLNNEPYTIEELVGAIEATLAGEVPPAPSGDGGDSGDDPLAPLPGDFSRLSFATPERLDELQTLDCFGQASSMSLTTADLTMVQVDRGRCSAGSDCSENQRQLKGMACAPGKTCGWRTLSIEVPGDAACDLGSAGQGGKEFFQVFATHFNWRADPNVDEWGVPSSLDDVTGPMVLGFRKDGTLFFSHQGRLPVAGDSSSLERALAAGATSQATGIDYPLFGASTFGSDPGATDMSAIRQGADYTVVGAFDRYCAGCIDELEHWSAAGQLADFCGSSSGFCQIFALEAELARPNTPDGRAAMYYDIKSNFLTPRGVEVPLLIDVDEFGDDYSRIFYSYLTPLNPDWGGRYGTVIYDREGKILAAFPGGVVHDPDPVLATLETLRSVGFAGASGP